MTKKKPDYFVKDLVIDDEYSIINSDATIVQAAQKMKELAIPDLVVIDKETKKVLGVIADFDIVQNVVADGKDPTTVKVTSAMYTIEPVTTETNVIDAFERMRDLHVNVVPVIENDKLLGVVTIQDVWSYIPDENIDEIGLIPVENPKNAEFWFASVCATFALILGFVLPLIGVVGFFNGIPQNVANDRVLHFFLLDAHGANYYISYLDVAGRYGFWIVVIIWSIITLIAGILGFFSIIYASFSDFQHFRTNQLVRVILPFIMIGALIIEWIILAIGMGVMAVAGSISVNILGLILSILAIIFVILALFRDNVFRQSIDTDINTAKPAVSGAGGK
ncbi:CBS domain-containing protein [Candidatus Harpocratesius sp.]